MSTIRTADLSGREPPLGLEGLLAAIREEMIEGWRDSTTPTTFGVVSSLIEALVNSCVPVQDPADRAWDAATSVVECTPVTDTIQALKNSGIDTECGACMEVAFTGVTTNAHTCRARAPETAPEIERAFRHGWATGYQECAEGRVDWAKEPVGSARPAAETAAFQRWSQVETAMSAHRAPAQPPGAAETEWTCECGALSLANCECPAEPGRARETASAPPAVDVEARNSLPVAGCIHCRPDRVCTYHRPENNMAAAPPAQEPTP